MNQEDRIAFSKKIVEAPVLIDAIDKSKASVQIEKQKVQSLDNGHKNLVDGKTTLIDAYQLELAKLDGIVRTNLTEADQNDAASLVLGNYFYPNDVNNPPPSTAPQVWTKTKPYARNKAVGKLFDETYGAPVTKESDLATLVDAAITSIEGTYALIERVTGQICTDGTCSLPAYVTQPTCVLNGGVWTPTVDTIVTYPAMQTAMTDLITKVNDLRAFLVAESALVYVNDTDATRKAQSIAAKNDIDNVIIPAIDAWLAVPSFNTSHGQTNCTGFYSYNAALLAPTKMSSAEITALKNALTARASFSSTRTSQVTAYLGSITQDLGTGNVTGTGLYYERWAFIQLRLNLLGGSLVALKGFDRVDTAQDEQIANINSAKAAYELLLKCTPLAAKASGTKYIHVKSSQGFSVGDTVYIITDGQAELTRNIRAIDGNRITLGQDVPANYRETPFGRMYKEL